MAGFFYTLMFAGLGVVVVCLLDPFGWFSGKGKRRAVVTGAPEAATPAPLPCENCGHLPGMPTIAELAASDRSDPAPTISAPAPVDNGCRDTPQANADTQPVDVRDLRAALGEDDTVTLPAVTTVTPVVAVDDTQMLVTWGTELPAKTKAAVEDWATGTAPGPMHEVPVGLGTKASIQVATALDEAS